jgi:hypothetical protein
MVELADTPDLGSGPEGWGFKSLSGYHIFLFRRLTMKKCFLLVILLIPVALFAAEDNIIRINKNIPTLVKVQIQGKIYKCNATIPGAPGKAIREANVLYSLDNNGNFAAMLQLDDDKIIDVAQCVSHESKMAFYKKLMDMAAKEAKEDKKELSLSRFVKDAIPPEIRFQIEQPSSK